jgi:hypothetical protein
MGREKALLAVCSLVFVSTAALATELGVAGTRFSLDGRPTFLLGISYYGALGAPDDFIRRDLDDMQRYGFSWIRVWATWAAFSNDVSAVDADGAARQPYFDKLRSLVADCDRRGMVVDITLSRGGTTSGATPLRTPAAHLRAVETLVTALKPYRNWYMDLANERNIRDQRFVGMGELRQLRDTAKQIDPGRLITASNSGGDLTREDVRQYLFEAGLDFLSEHRPRGPESAAQTEAKTKEVLGWMDELGRLAPLHYQETLRRGYGRGWQPTATDLATDLAGARAGGAAGWCFHNGDSQGRPGNEPRRSFDLRKHRLFEQLDKQEQAFLMTLLHQQAHGLKEEKENIHIVARARRAF